MGTPSRTHLSHARLRLKHRLVLQMVRARCHMRPRILLPWPPRLLSSARRVRPYQYRLAQGISPLRKIPPCSFTDHPGGHKAQAEGCQASILDSQAGICSCFLLSPAPLMHRIWVFMREASDSFYGRHCARPPIGYPDLIPQALAVPSPTSFDVDRHLNFSGHSVCRCYTFSSRLSQRFPRMSRGLPLPSPSVTV